MLEALFTSLISKFIDDQNRITVLWNDVEKKHSVKGRHYHTLAHLKNLYKQLLPVKKYIKDWDMILFALFYHDYIYNPLKNNNEEKSSEKCIAILSELGVTKDRIELCNQIIIATKGHQISNNSDVNYFTDADLSILGADWKIYEQYFKNVRKEYRFYPNFAYNKGRVKVLNSFLEMPQIFKTDHFYDLYEKQTLKNLQKEIEILKK